jgi:hypothetical protein
MTQQEKETIKKLNTDLNRSSYNETGEKLMFLEDRIQSVDINPTNENTEYLENLLD